MHSWQHACDVGRHYLDDTTADFSNKILGWLISVLACYTTWIPWGVGFAILFLLLDIATGNLKAWRSHTWISRKSFMGFFKILIYIWAFIGTFLFDEAMWHILSTLPVGLLERFAPTFVDLIANTAELFKHYHIVTNFVAAFAIITDFGSNLENLYEMGFPVPKLLRDRLKIAQKAMDTWDGITILSETTTNKTQHETVSIHYPENSLSREEMASRVSSGTENNWNKS